MECVERSSYACLEEQGLMIVFYPHPSWQRMLVLCLLCPMLGQQETNLQIRYVFAAWDLDEMQCFLIVFNMEVESAIAFNY
jgi:hypothetical protein